MEQFNTRTHQRGFPALVNHAKLPEKKKARRRTSWTPTERSWTSCRGRSGMKRTNASSFPFRPSVSESLDVSNAGESEGARKKWQVRVVCQKQNESLEEEARTGSCKDQTLAPAASVL